MSPPTPQQVVNSPEVQQALGYFDQVVGMVKANNLPGPVVPDMLSKVTKLTSKSDVSFVALSNFCSQHQALSAKLLGVVNSAYYLRGGSRVTNLEMAIARIGLRQTSNILHGVATRSYLVGKDPELRKTILGNLETAFVVALAAQWQAQHDHYAKANDTYTVGLFHNIGFTFFLYTLGLMQDKKQIGNVDVKSLAVVARRRGSEFNRIVAKELELPEEIVAALLLPKDASDDLAKIVSYVHRSMWCAEKLLTQRKPADIQMDVEAEVLGVTPEVCDLMGQQAAAWLTLLEQYGSQN